MKDYISCQEALDLIDIQKLKWEESEGAVRDGLRVLRRAIQYGLVFSIIEPTEGELLVQKDSVAKFFGNWGKLKDKVAFEHDELLAKKLEHFSGFENLEYRHLCVLNLRDSYDDIFGNIVIDSIYVHYYISEEAGTAGILKASLESEGTYAFLTEISCGPEVGFDVMVKHYDNDIVAWASLVTNIGVTIPCNLLEGYRFNEEDAEEFEATISLARTKAESEKKEIRDKVWKIRDRAREVLIPLPIFFSRKQLFELVKDVRGRVRMF